MISTGSDVLKRIAALWVLLALTGCSNAYEGGWKYERTEDKLRQLFITTASTRSLEIGGMYPVVSLEVRKGSFDEDGVFFSSIGLNCHGNAQVAIRVDDAPIEYLTCTNPQYFYVNLPLESDLAKRIMASKEVVIESGGQWSFNTAGLKI